MIVVTVELVSAISPDRDKVLGRMCIANDGSIDDPTRGNYDAWVRRKGTTSYRSATRIGRVENFPRQSYVIWRLVLRALRSCYPEEK